MPRFFIRQCVSEYYAIDADTVEEAMDKLFDDEVKPYEIDYQEVYVDDIKEVQDA